MIETGIGSSLALLHASGPLVDHRHQMAGALATAAWALRQNVSFYDGLYVALAVPLVTADQRLARAPSLSCVVEQVGSGCRAYEALAARVEPA